MRKAFLFNVGVGRLSCLDQAMPTSAEALGQELDQTPKTRQETVTATAGCSLVCNTSMCYTTATPLLDCMRALPFNATWANNTLEVLTKSLDNFGFRALYHNTGPPYNIELDLQGELTQVADSLPLSSDAAFQEAVQAVLTKLLDAHTRYRKPNCYNGVFAMPFSFDLQLPIMDACPNGPADGTSCRSGGPRAVEPLAFLRRNVYTEHYESVFRNVDLSAVLDKQLLLVDNLDFTTAIAGWGNTHETRSNHPSARFNAALRSFTVRDARYYNVLDGSVSEQGLALTVQGGVSVTLPWLGGFTQAFGVPEECTMKPQMTAEDLMLVNGRPLFEPGAPHERNVLELQTTRTVIVPPDSNSTLSCFTQDVSSFDKSKEASVSIALVIKVASFSPNGPYKEAWQGFTSDAAACLGTAHDLVLLDVMQNGGGYVCLGMRLLEMLVEDYAKDHKQVQMIYDLPHSSLMDAYISAVNNKDPYSDPQEVEQILNIQTQQPFVDGKAYYYPGRNQTQGGSTIWKTNQFTLNCKEAEVMPVSDFKPHKWFPPSRIIIMSDGTCGSTCASFTKIAQEAGKATFVGVGGLWGQPMDVSSFAGGFVCNPSYLANISRQAGLPPFPEFITNQRWQFGWSSWYSARFPSRPAQFTEQEPDFREPFWNFPDASINSTESTKAVSALYDRILASTILRLAETAEPSSSNGKDGDTTVPLSYVIGIAVAGTAALLGWAIVLCRMCANKGSTRQALNSRLLDEAE